MTRLRELAGVTIEDSPAGRDEASTDFGGLARGNVLAVVRPHQTDGLVELVRLARQLGLSLAPRALGYSQSGQSIPREGVSVDMRGFQGIEIDRERGVARCGAATTWRQLTTAASSMGLAPEVAPLNMDLSVGGTLSAGGMGSTSHRYGMAVSSVLSLQVVTGAGELVDASPTRRPDVFEAVLGGVGQFGFICSVELRLRPMLPRLRTYFLLYDDLPAMLADEVTLMTQPWCTHLEGYATAAIQGVRLAASGDRREPLPRWFYGLQLSEECSTESTTTAQERLAGLHHRELVHVQEEEAVSHAGRYDIRFEMMRGTGQWTMPHPWYECMVPHDVAVKLLPDIIAGLPMYFGDGHRLIPLADVPRPRFSVRPEGKPTMFFALLPTSIPPPRLEEGLQVLHRIHDLIVSVGGKRYISGWQFEPDQSAWRTHYGEHYDAWRAAKHALDPDSILQSCLFAR